MSLPWAWAQREISSAPSAATAALAVAEVLRKSRRVTVGWEFEFVFIVWSIDVVSYA
jgi:hypothetical protein